MFKKLLKFQPLSHSAYGTTPAMKAKWFAKATAGSFFAGFLISEYILTDEVVEPVSKKLEIITRYIEKTANDIGVSLPFVAHAFSTPDHGLHAPHYPFGFQKWWATYDHAALRRGYQVYREICAACHSMNYICWRNLVGVTHTEAEVKAMAAEYEYRDGPNDQGEYFMRPGKNYIFALLTGYQETPPAGVEVREGLHYNPYFHGGAIAMARSVYDGVVDYEDETDNNASQIAKDVSEFLTWASYPELDQRKKMGLKVFAVCGILLGLSVWWKRFKWSYVKSRQVVFKPPKFPKV